MFDLTDNVAIITGGNGGLGLAYGRGLVKAGCRVAVWGRNAEKNAAAVEELRKLGGEAESFTCDVTDEAQTKAVLAKTVDHFGQVDICFANAGGGGFRGMSHMTSREDWLSTVDLNLMSVVHTFAAVTEHLLARKASGRLIVTSSVAATVGTGGAAGYSTTKAAVKGLVQALAVELGQAGIRVNAIMPHAKSPALKWWMEQNPEEAAHFQASIPLGRVGECEEDVGAFVAMMCGDEARYLTGQTIALDGGQVFVG